MEMEVVLGIGEEARPKACSSESRSGEKVAQENGVENREEKLLGDAEKTKENAVDSGVMEDCVMNGVSSLLKLKQDLSDIQEEKEIEEEEEEVHGYCVGDFVWGKIKNHPWWPGQIYHNSDASDLALKRKQKGKLLVAYFGDGTFAWCAPSQLRPFSDSFKECSTISNSKSFLTAVEEAVEEIGCHIERLLICDCADQKHHFDSPEAKNSGIKEGVLVPHVRREIFSSLVVGKPGVILQDVKTSAETVSFGGLLDLEILKRKISAFFRSKRGYGLTEYHEPQPVPGLEDKNKDDEDESIDDGSSQEEEVEEEDEASDPEDPIQRSLEKCSGFPDHRLQHRRKQKSIAEILQNESAAKVRFETEPADGNVKSITNRREEGKGELENISTTTPRIRKMSELSTIQDAGHKKVKENGKDKTSSRKKKKRDVDDDDNDNDDDGIGGREESAHVEEEIDKNEVSDLKIDNDSTPLVSLQKRVRVDGTSVEKNAENGETPTLTQKRERKKSKYLSPDYLSDFSWKGRKKSKTGSESSKILSQSQVGGEQMTCASGSLVVVEDNKFDKSHEPALDNGFSHHEPSQELSDAVDFLRLGATPEELRDLIRVTALGTQYPEDNSSRNMVRDFMFIYRSFAYQDGANSKLLGSCISSDKEKEELIETGKPEAMGKDRKDKKLKAKQQAEEIKQIGKAENETNKHETTRKERKSMKFESKKQADEKEKTPEELIESTMKERKPKKSKLKKQADEKEETLEGSTSESTKKDRKPKRPKSNKQADEDVETLKESNESKKGRKPKRPTSEKQAYEEEETRKESSETMKKERVPKKPKAKKQADEEEKTLKESSGITKNERKRKKVQHEKEETLNETEKPEEKKKKREGKSKKQKVDEKKIETEKKFAGAELFVTFGPGSNLPKKEELIEIYEKFGVLDEERTYMFFANYCGRVAFLNIADGEKAFESSQEKCPFASTSTVRFRLKYPNEKGEEKKAGAGAEVEVAETTIEMEYVKTKLEEMRSLVDESEGGISEEKKVKLEDEMVNLLEKVRKMRSF